ncbi:transcription termination factor MTEF18, mitochondrial-like [Gastrolobium bilobum]|uniref:transcription termination factor MTEF18, mitochondrial-like n=1 Tax=Gastrolobium bilobum TaxID=150636 RepID=UPI002AAFE287|nr:transcription termination factor MTEF18, mitochondrial-like [Gastrolobium bilobum]
MFSNIFSFLHRHFSITTKLPNLSKIPTRHRNFVIREAQKSLTDYLHGTRCLPFTYAEQIGNNTLRSLTNLIAKVDFSASSFSKNFEKVLRYHPINEFEVFFESIGIEYNLVSGLLPNDKVFFSQDGTLLDAACALSDFGFPWENLGVLYMERRSIFGRSGAELKSRLSVFKGFGFGNVEVIGICLAFPFVLCEEGQGGVGIDGLFNDLKLIFLDFALARSVEGNVDSWHEVCRKLRVFFDLNCWDGKLGELMGRNKSIFLEHKEEDLVNKVEYFCRFGGKKEEVARLILQCPELLNLDMEKPAINVLKLLNHFGLSSKDLEDVSRNFAHVLGTNKMVNLPNIMRALGLQEWFFNKIKDGHHHLLGDYITSYPNEDQDKDYQDGLRMIHISRARVHSINKLNFLHGLGFGENALTMNVLNHLHGTSSELQERFDCLLRSRIEFSKLCMMVRMTPRILNQNSRIIERKVNFFHQEMGTTLDYVETFPAILYYHLEDRIIPRYRFHIWLTEKGLCSKRYSVRSMIANTEKEFVARVFKIHPAAPKHWFEQFCHIKLSM